MWRGRGIVACGVTPRWIGTRGGGGNRRGKGPAKVERSGEGQGDDIVTESGRTFQQMGVSFEKLEFLSKMGVELMFPIQERTYRAVRDGHDLIGRAKTGTGKTLAYLLPLLERYESRCEGAANKPFLMVLSKPPSLKRAF